MIDTPPVEPAQEPPVEKPKRNWRGWLKEYAVIVIGVLTALAAQQAAEWFHWRAQVAEAKELIATEMAFNVVGAIHRIRTAACTESRLDSLSRIVDEAARTGNLPAVGDIGSPPRRSWPSGAWQAVVASQTATHFPPQQFVGLSGTYKTIERIEVVYAAEGDFWRDLYTIVGPGRRLNPASEETLRLALSRARINNRIMATLAAALLARQAVQELPYSANDRAMMAMARNGPLSGPKPAPGDICEPVGRVADSYGQGSFGAVPSVIAEGIRAMPDFSKPAR